ncbi:hypothetical protein glysoja_045271 [Glycine soja]|uniref:Uncharacterized protein n=1 Tax=Glycine soja TaxID=3848 RepID=A0A0B2RGE5_GLYSO|nr:hypothetical protein glysoja_045271 [Glycine soja]
MNTGSFSCFVCQSLKFFCVPEPSPMCFPRHFRFLSPNSKNTAVSDEPPRRKFRYTPVVVLEEQKKMNVVKAEHEPTIETDQLAARQTNVTHEMQGKLNMNEMLEETKDSNIGNLDLGSDFQSNTGGNSQNSDAQLENSM